MVKVSVILPIYNEEQYLEQCMDSICGQTLKEIEIICVDDGSTDSSLQILREHEKRDARIKVITQQNQYAGVARNHGMKYATGKYLSFLDSDDYFEPDMLEKMFQKAEEKDADIVICRYAEHDDKSGEVSLLNWSFEDLFFNEKESFTGAALNCAGIFQITKGWAWDKLFRTEFVKACGYEFPDFRSSEDGFFVYMLMARAGKISYMDDVLAIHRINNENSLSNTKETDWINGCKMWQMIGRELKAQGLYQTYEQSFLNELVYFMVWYLDSMNEPETLQKCYDFIRQGIEPEFGILDYGKENFFQEEVWDWYCEHMNLTEKAEPEQYICKICGAEGNHKSHHVKEMFFGTGKEFLYFECEQCQCLQIADIPDDLDEFYGNAYYSFAAPRIPEAVAAQKIETHILDVGCGAGKWLLEKYAQGHVNLYGCDPFIEKDICYESCIHIKKCTIHEMQGTFDLIRLSDSFEHMADPYETLLSIKRLLSDGGMCLISMPVFPNAAYDMFGVDWYEWDAPRHLFLHSVKSMEYLCRKAGLRIENVNFNARDLQFISSLLYQQGIPYVEQTAEVIESRFTPEELHKFTEYTDALNARGYGDHAVFVIMKQ